MKKTNISFIKKERKFALVKYKKSSNIYNEIYEFLLSVNKNKSQIEKKIKDFPNMNYNQVLSYFQIVYPDRMNSDSHKDIIQRRAFRKLCSNFKIENNRLMKHNPYKSNIDKNEDLWYNIPLEEEKINIIDNFHWNNNHCGRDALLDFIKRNNWYWYGFYDEVNEFIKSCPKCDNCKSKFKNIKAPIKIIIDKGPHYRYIADLWYLSKEISLLTGYNYILDVIDHFSKWYQGYALKSKSSDEVLTYLDLFFQSFGKPIIFQSDNGLEFCNSELINYCVNNDIKIVHGRPRHPQSQGACESCHREIKKYIYGKYYDDKENFNINKALVEIINIHNNKKHSVTGEIPKDIRDITDLEQIKNINDRIVKNIGRKNKNIDLINYEHYYCINSELIIKYKKLYKNNKKAKKNSEKIPILILSESERENEFIIEIQKNCGKFNKGESYLITSDLLLETNESLWKKLL